MWKLISPLQKLQIKYPNTIVMLVLKNLDQFNPSIKNLHKKHETKRSFASYNNTNRIKNPFYGLPREQKNEHFLSPTEKLSLAITSGTSVLLNPERADALAALSEVTGGIALRNIYDRMMNDVTGQCILRDKPLVNSNTMDIHSMLEVNIDNRSIDTRRRTFGEAYARFMLSHGFDPDERSQVKHVSDPDLAYVMLRYRQCHDFFHTLFDLPPTVLGELALKYVELLQTGLPSTALSVTLGKLQLTSKERYLLHTLYLPWAVQIGTKSTCFLMNVYYEKELDTDLEVLRKRLGVFPAPNVNETFEAKEN